MDLRLLIKRAVPAPVLRRASAFVRYAPHDVLRWARGRSDPLIPSRSRDFVGGGNYREIGDEFFGYFRSIADVQPTDRVLDIGCGIGRMARPFVPFLVGRGSYDGFDIDAQGIRWCQERYASYPHFRFVRVDIRNEAYNPRGTIEAEEFQFP